MAPPSSSQPVPRDALTLRWVLVILLLVAVVDFLFTWTRSRMIARLVGYGTAQMRKDAFAAAVNRDLAFYDDNKSGKIVSRITSDTQEFASIFTIFSDIFIQFVSLF